MVKKLKLTLQTKKRIKRRCLQKMVKKKTYFTYKRKKEKKRCLQKNG